MNTLIISSSFTFYKLDEQNNKIPTVIDNNNGFLDMLKSELKTRKCMLVISGKPDKVRMSDPLDITRAGFAKSGIPFDEYIYLDSRNMHNLDKYLRIADCIDLCGGHLPTCNEFINRIKLKDKISQFKGVIIGASGGGMNLAGEVYCKPEEQGEALNENFNKSLKGLALTNISIVPHFNVIRSKTLDGKRILQDILLPDSMNKKLIALNDGSYIVQKGDRAVIHGEAYQIYKGKLTQICENDRTCTLLNVSGHESFVKYMLGENI